MKRSSIICALKGRVLCARLLYESTDGWTGACMCMSAPACQLPVLSCVCIQVCVKVVSLCVSLCSDHGFVFESKAFTIWSREFK